MISAVHPPISAAGVAQTSRIATNSRHAENARRQFPPVKPSTNSGTTQVQPKMNSGRIAHCGIRLV